MRLPKMNDTERAVFAACYAAALARQPEAVGNEAADAALEEALWDVECFRQALRERKP